MRNLIAIHPTIWASIEDRENFRNYRSHKYSVWKWIGNHNKYDEILIFYYCYQIKWKPKLARSRIKELIITSKNWFRNRHKMVKARTIANNRIDRNKTGKHHQNLFFDTSFLSQNQLNFIWNDSLFSGSRLFYFIFVFIFDKFYESYQLPERFPKCQMMQWNWQHFTHLHIE